jgi:hypothetical protein
MIYLTLPILILNYAKIIFWTELEKQGFAADPLFCFRLLTDNNKRKDLSFMDNNKRQDLSFTDNNKRQDL